METAPIKFWEILLILVSKIITDGIWNIWYVFAISNVIW